MVVAQLRSMIVSYTEEIFLDVLVVVSGCRRLESMIQFLEQMCGSSLTGIVQPLVNGQD